MNILIAGKTEEICDSIAQLLLELDCDNISIFTSGTIIRGVDISKFDSVIISTPLSDEFGLDLVADIAKDTKNGVVVLAKCRKRYDLQELSYCRDHSTRLCLSKQ